VSAVSLSRNGVVATLALDRPEARNALEPAMMVELRDLVTALPHDGTRVLILTGAGDVFCAGADIDWMRRSRDLTPEQNVADAAVMRSLLDALDACPLPIVARVNGHALGGGSGLVAIADTAVSVSDARFGFTEARLGLIPATISPYVLRKIGAGHAQALFTTAVRFGAERAMRIGLVHEVCEPDQLDHRVADAVLAYLECGPAAIAETKRLLRDATAQLRLPDLPERLAAVRAGPEAQEGLAAFLEKRKPRWAPDSSAS
jgi:enoyl-CoA hydratase/carnithine racemase